MPTIQQAKIILIEALAAEKTQKTQMDQAHDCFIEAIQTFEEASITQLNNTFNPQNYAAVDKRVRQTLRPLQILKKDYEREVSYYEQCQLATRAAQQQLEQTIAAQGEQPPLAEEAQQLATAPEEAPRQEEQPTIEVETRSIEQSQPLLVARQNEQDQRTIMAADQADKTACLQLLNATGFSPEQSQQITELFKLNQKNVAYFSSMANTLIRTYHLDLAGLFIKLNQLQSFDNLVRETTVINILLPSPTAAANATTTVISEPISTAPDNASSRIPKQHVRFIREKSSPLAKRSKTSSNASIVPADQNAIPFGVERGDQATAIHLSSPDRSPLRANRHASSNLTSSALLSKLPSPPRQPSTTMHYDVGREAPNLTQALNAPELSMTSQTIVTTPRFTHAPQYLTHNAAKQPSFSLRSNTSQSDTAWQQYFDDPSAIAFVMEKIQPGSSNQNRCNKGRHQLINAALNVGLTPKQIIHALKTQSSFENLRSQVRNRFSTSMRDATRHTHLSSPAPSMISPMSALSPTAETHPLTRLTRPASVGHKPT